MENFRFDDRNFLVVEQITVYKVAVDVYDNRTGAETTLLMLLDCNNDYVCRDIVKDICCNYGYTMLKCGEPQKLKLDLNTLEKE